MTEYDISRSEQSPFPTTGNGCRGVAASVALANSRVAADGGWRLMPDLLARPLVPVATEDDAAATMAALLPRLDPGTTVTVCHVIEKAGGAPDKAGVEQRQELAEGIFGVARRLAADADADVAVDARLEYGTDVADAVFAAAADVDATAIAFTPRGGARWVRFLTGDTTLDLVTETDRPVVVLPDADRDTGGVATDTEGGESA